MRRTLVTGHRGAAGLEPENTLRSFRRACDLGVNHVETDVHVTRDTRVVCIHDACVDRTTDGAGEVMAMSLAEIRTLDAGQGERIPTLEEALETVHGRAALQIELKSEDSVVPTIAVLEKLSVSPDDVFIISFNPDLLTEVRRRRPDLRTSLLLRWLDGDVIPRARDLGFCGISPYYQEVTASRVKEAHHGGLELHTWTVNDPEEMERLLRLGVNGIATDRPDILVPLAAAIP